MSLYYRYPIFNIMLGN